MMLAACSSGGGADSQDQVDAAAAKEVFNARISVAPKDGADNVGINTDVKVQISGGKLTDVELMGTGSTDTVAGEFSADRTSWTPSSQLKRATQYKLAVTGKDTKGREETKHSTFTTVSPAHSFIGYYTPDDGATVGVGMPVSIKFDKAITNQADVEKAITVTSSSGQQVVGHWFDQTRLDFRPESYWVAGSTISLKLRLDDVEGAAGVYGVQSKDVTFHIGRSQISTVDVTAKTMTVKRDGATLKTIPITAGSPDHPTYNGQMVISEKFKETRMNGDTVGFEGEYDIADVPHAMRLSSSGTFVHGNYWASKGTFGTANTSHGCVGLQDVKGAGDPSTPAAWFFAHSLVGDVVVVMNSPDETINPANGLNGWNMSWADWQAGSKA